MALFARNQHPPLFHHIEMLGEVANGDLEPAGQAGNRHLPFAQGVQDLQAGGMRKHFAHIRMVSVEFVLGAGESFCPSHIVFQK